MAAFTGKWRLACYSLTFATLQCVEAARHCYSDEAGGIITLFSYVAAYADVFLGAPLGVLAIVGMIFGAIGVSYAKLYPNGKCCCYAGASPGRCRNCCPTCAGSCCDRCTSDIFLANKVLLALQTPAAGFGVVCFLGGAVQQIICQAVDPIWPVAVLPWLALMCSGWATSLAAVVKLRRAYCRHGPPKLAPVDSDSAHVTLELSEVLTAPSPAVMEGLMDADGGTYRRLD